MLTAIAAAFIFLVVILVHELGHFTVAKLVGIQVNEFAIGMGPKIFQREKGETKYTLRLIPIGGYVSMEGEDEDSDNPRSFSNVSAGKRLAVLSAGAIMNFILAILVLIIVFTSIGTPTRKIEEIIEGSPAENSSLQAGDEIVRIDGVEIKTWEDVVENISGSEEGKSLKVEYIREGREEFTDVKPIFEQGRAIIGIIPARHKSFTNAVKMSFVETKNILGQMFNFIGMLFTGNIGTDMLQGPVGVIGEIGNAAKMGVLNVLLLLALISINLGFFNLLPIPALDGGRIFLTLIELLRGKPMDPNREGMVHFIGFVMLIGLMLVVTFKDIAKILF